MKRLARIIGILGGVGAVVWAMRDRFVSVAISREPEPPAFQVPESANTTTTSTEDEAGRTDITRVAGIGPVYATRLEEVGISTVGDLAGSRPEEVAAATQVPLSRAVGWVDEAKSVVAD